MSVPRAITLAFEAVEHEEGGQGAKLRRSIAVPQLKNLNPFLMLAHFSSTAAAGFPDHPHRGQETITFMLSGELDHEDFAGGKGTIGTGDLQFMTAGRGIMHAEIPKDNGDGSLIVGLQLWVDLPKELKECEPRYRDLKAGDIPTVTADNGKVAIKVISGRSQGVDSVQDLVYTPIWILDVTMKAGAKLEQDIPTGYNAFVYTLQGSTTFNSGPEEKDTIAAFHNVVFEQKGDTITAETAADASEDSRFLIVAGQPLEQEIVHQGFFVATSQERIDQTRIDFQTASNGFERREGWQSEIGKAQKV